MSRQGMICWAMLIGVNVLVWCVLGFYGTSGAAPQGDRQPFNNAVEQRNEMIRELSEIKALLKEQNALLRAQIERDTGNERIER